MLFISYFFYFFYLCLCKKVVGLSTTHQVRFLLSFRVNCEFSHLESWRLPSEWRRRTETWTVTSDTAARTGMQMCTWNNTHTRQIPSGTITAHSTRAWGTILWNQKHFAHQLSSLVSTGFKDWSCGSSKQWILCTFWTTIAPAEEL